MFGKTIKRRCYGDLKCLQVCVDTECESKNEKEMEGEKNPRKVRWTGYCLYVFVWGVSLLVLWVYLCYAVWFHCAEWSTELVLPPSHQPPALDKAIWICSTPLSNGCEQLTVLEALSIFLGDSWWLHCVGYNEGVVCWQIAPSSEPLLRC